MEINNNYINIDISSLNCIGDNRCREKTIIKYPIIIGIYKITSKNGAIYIGLSNDIYQRLYKYKKLRCKLQLKLYNSLIKYGVESHKFEIIHTIQKDNLEKKYIYQKLRDLEIYYIKKFNSFYGDNDKFGLNLTRGGDLMELTEESRNLIRIKNKGRIVSKETRIKISNFHKGKPLSEEHRVKISKSNKGKKISEETRKKLIESHKGEKHTIERIQKKIGKKQSLETIRKRVEQYSGENHWTRRKKISQETKDKISKTLKGKFVGINSPSYGIKKSEEHKKKLSEIKKGVKRTIESRIKQSNSISGKNHHNYGKKYSEEHKKKLSEAHKGKNLTEEQKYKKSIKMKLYWENKKKKDI